MTETISCFCHRETIFRGGREREEGIKIVKQFPRNHLFFFLFCKLEKRDTFQLPNPIFLWNWRRWWRAEAQPATLARKNGSSVGTCTCCVHVFFHVLVPICMLSRWLSTKISASELRRKFLKVALLVGKKKKKETAKFVCTVFFLFLFLTKLISFFGKVETGLITLVMRERERDRETYERRERERGCCRQGCQVIFCFCNWTVGRGGGGKKNILTLSKIFSVDNIFFSLDHFTIWQPWQRAIMSFSLPPPSSLCLITRDHAWRWQHHHHFVCVCHHHPPPPPLLCFGHGKFLIGFHSSPPPKWGFRTTYLQVQQTPDMHLVNSQKLIIVYPTWTW